MSRTLAASLAAIAIVVGLGLGMFVAAGGQPAPSPSRDPGHVAANGSTPPSTPEPASSGPSAAPTDGPSQSPGPTPAPTPVLVPAPLTGQPVTKDVAARHPIAVMIDDQRDARPQSGFNAASVVWQAPAEGGIPRYMLVFQDQIPTDVGPVRSARYYYIAWAAEWRAVYVHSGGSPQALATLRSKGRGQLVFNADEFAWAGYFHRITTRVPPHNLFTTGKQLRTLAGRLQATDKVHAPVWRFAPDAPLSSRPTGGRIEVAYLANRIRYDYDATTNTYLRSIGGGTPQRDAATGVRVAPKNVVIMLMHFGPLKDGSRKHRLEATVVGQGTAWISTNGKTIPGKWKKASLTKPTLFFDASGKPVTLTIGQTFVQVMATGTKVTVVAGKPPVPETTPIWPNRPTPL